MLAVAHAPRQPVVPSGPYKNATNPLSNFNTRTNGFNQLNTTVRRHTDENFADALRYAEEVGGREGLELYFELVRDPHKGLRRVRRGGEDVVEENVVT